MRFFNVMVIRFYELVLILIGILMIVYSFNVFHPQDINDFLSYVQDSLNARLIFGLSGLLLILISFSFAQLILGRLEREKTIAFMTPSGEVTIALTAIEDLIKHFVTIMPEIRELRPDVIATRKGGLVVNLKAVLKSEANLPELTARLQEITKSKIQEVLGLEEQVTIRIHISKIISRDEKDKRRKDTEKEEPPILFGGYGRV